MSFPLPPRESWHPGRVTRDIVLVRADRLHVVLCAPEIYPTGAIVQIIARFRGFPEPAEQQEAARQLGSFHRGPHGRDGPRLRYRYGPSGALAEGLANGHGMAGRAAALCFWLPGTVADAAGLSGEFHWPGQSVHAPFAIEGAEVAWALASAEQVWPEP